jgi:hypothetical protein
VQREFEEAVDEHGETTGERARRHAAPEFIFRVEARKPVAKEREDEQQAEQAADDSGVCENL